ncbi:tyrosine phosphatase yvh1 [Fusarium heterosporum]|uniref:protein-tyrosine-phosphatase n=1 Tax=Fusarium heterosporum TaxID=42747 RepID=A0A8H5SZU8_FUSHE|nr:tyrosine phosphatase yvh1 [Fusarium heterosporum]
MENPEKITRIYTKIARPNNSTFATCDSRLLYNLAEDNGITKAGQSTTGFKAQGNKEDESKPQQREEIGHQFEPGELELLKQSIVKMALSRIDGQDELFVGGLWALRRSDSLTDRRITHVLSLVPFDISTLKNFKDEPWIDYGKDFRHTTIDIDDVEDADLLIELPKAVRFIEEGLGANWLVDEAKEKDDDQDGGVLLEKGVEELDIVEKKRKKKGGVFVHCAAGKSRSVSAVIAYLLRQYPSRFDPNITPTEISDPAHSVPQSSTEKRSRKETAQEAVHAALTFVRRTRPMAEPNEGFMEQLALWWEMGCPNEVETHPVYQRWAYKREIDENLAVGQAPTRLRFEDEETQPRDESGLSLRCKKCRRTLVTAPFIQQHRPSEKQSSAPTCQHYFVEPLSWMRGVLEQGELNGRLICPNEKCGAGVGRYDWKGFRCSCGGWVTPAFSLQKARVDDVVKLPTGQNMGIRMPPGMAPRNGNL